MFCVDAFAVETYRVRSNINPACSATTTKFADLFGENNIAVQGSYACRGAFIFDITNPDAPILASWYNPSPTRQFLEAVIFNGRGYFGSGSGGGVHIVDLTNPYTPVLLGTVDSTHGNGHNTIHEMVVFQQNGGTYLIENWNGFENKTLKIINVTNPAAPVFVRDLIPTEPQWVHAMVVKGNRLFTSGWGNSSFRGRTEIYDISNIGMTAPTLLGFISDLTSVTAGNAMHSAWPSENGNYLYSAREIGNPSVTNPGDIRVYDISNPSVPLLIRKIRSVDLGINASTPHNPVVMGNKLYVAWYQAGLQVFDISNPADPVRIGEYDTYLPAFTEEQRAEQLRELAKYDPADIVCGRSMSNDLAVTGYDGAWAVYPYLGEDKVLVGDLETGLYIIDVTAGTPTPTATPTATPTSTPTATPTPTPMLNSISGVVTYGIIAKPVPGVLLNALGSPRRSSTTDMTGGYSLNDLGGGPYTVVSGKPAQACGVSNGIFAQDASIVSQHVVGLQTLTGDALEAAKVAGAPTVSSVDAGLIARRVVGLCTDVTSLAGEWRFTPVSRSYAGINGQINGENYTAILMGDVNGDWDPADLDRPDGLTSDKDAPRVSLPKINASSGSTITVPLRIDQLRGVGISSYQFDIEYDPGVIEPQQFASDLTGTLGEGLAVAYNVPSPGLLKVAVYGAIPVSGDGVYANLRFSVIGTKGTDSPLVTRNFYFNDSTIPVMVVNGRVSVTDADAIIGGGINTSPGEKVQRRQLFSFSTVDMLDRQGSLFLGYGDAKALELNLRTFIY